MTTDPTRLRNKRPFVDQSAPERGLLAGDPTSPHHRPRRHPTPPDWPLAPWQRPKMDPLEFLLPCAVNADKENHQQLDRSKAWMERLPLSPRRAPAPGSPQRCGPRSCPCARVQGGPDEAVPGVGRHYAAAACLRIEDQTQPAEVILHHPPGMVPFTPTVTLLRLAPVASGRRAPQARIRYPTAPPATPGCESPAAVRQWATVEVGRPTCQRVLAGHIYLPRARLADGCQTTELLLAVLRSRKGHAHPP